jgi:phosphonate transport system substrate-binding protein
MKAFLALFATLILLPITGAAADSSPAVAPSTELAFGIISTESATGLRLGFEPFLEKLSARLGIKVRGFYASDYAGVIEAMRFGKVHLAWMGNAAAIQAVDRAGAEVFAQSTGPDGSTGFSSVIIVPATSPYADVDALVAAGSQLSFGNGDPLSTTGNLIPNYYLWAPRKIDPRRAFKRVRNANHEVNALAVAAGQVDFATNNTEWLVRLRQRHPEAAAKLRVIWTSPEIPRDPLVYRADLPREMKTRLQAAFLAFGRIGPDAEDDRRLLAALADGWGPFLAADNRQLLTLRRFELERDLMMLEAETRLDPEEKAKRLDAARERQRQLLEYEKLGQFWNTVKAPR